MLCDQYHCICLVSPRGWRSHRSKCSHTSRSLRSPGSDFNVFGSVLSLFFFSSRRRHTRYWRDWSSDVCSSDLKPPRSRRAFRLKKCRPKFRPKSPLLRTPIPMPRLVGSVIATRFNPSPPMSGRRSPLLIKKRSEEHTSELQSRQYLVCRLLLEK